MKKQTKIESLEVLRARRLQIRVAKKNVKKRIGNHCSDLETTAMNSMSTPNSWLKTANFLINFFVLSPSKNETQDKKPFKHTLDGALKDAKLKIKDLFSQFLAKKQTTNERG